MDNALHAYHGNELRGELYEREEVMAYNVIIMLLL